MNQDKRNRKNANYKANLAKRNGETKASDYKKMCSSGIEQSEKIIPMKHEFIQTKRGEKLITREVYLFEWTKAAKDARKEYHSTKNGLAVPAISKPKEIKEKLSKEARLASREFSSERTKMITKAFSKENNYLRQAAEQSKHEIVIENMIQKLRAQKNTQKLKNDKNKPFKVDVVYQNEGNNYSARSFYSSDPLDKISEVVSLLNKELSEKSEYYHHTAVKDNHHKDKVLLLYPRNEQAA